MNNICVVGLGYIGLPTAAVFASRRYSVTGFDINPLVVKTINQGDIHIIEPELEILVRSAVREGYLVAANQPVPADVFIISVPTPIDDSDKRPDLSHVLDSVKRISGLLHPDNLVIIESTCPAGTTKAVAKLIADLRPDLVSDNTPSLNLKFHLAHCPERVLPGNVIREIVSNDRIIGGLTEEAGRKAAEFYSTIVHGECIITDTVTAEICKLTENAFRDVNIAFANELALICDDLDVDVWEVRKLANRHPRVNVLEPGPGVGGHCIAVDPWFLIDSSPKHSILLRAARSINDATPGVVLESIRNKVEDIKSRNNADRPIVSCLGITFKPDVDDVRGSPALYIVESLAEDSQIILKIVEPNCKELPASLKRENVMLSGLDEALDDTRLVVILVHHEEFLEVNWPSVNAPIIDTRGVTRSKDSERARLG